MTEAKKKPLAVKPVMEIGLGDWVEVFSDEDGFLGSYYEARVLEKLGDAKFLVEYKNLVTEEDETVRLQEEVKASRMRPKPPAIRVPGYDVLDKVDAFDNDGWWVGRITGQDARNKYSVYFESSGDEIVYSVDRLRPHLEYENGKWIRSAAGIWY
ncbi:OLC1v1023233C1 [Oldenlandia corymbosa var. corymbosa]|uniref:OLC1v1023233C1 n=1 Tax=Oldenlandia corymbosa var. corymbosa TaxID=529605 RepID=A0AAV1C1Z4_OLDCO|nr:OLC1v1023233C1 [Oldenlandia corymbosa var. corymbosa]